MAKQRTENVPPAALWKDTFSDLMNLLLCFFVLMFAMSNIDSQKRLQLHFHQALVYFLKAVLHCQRKEFL